MDEELAFQRFDEVASAVGARHGSVTLTPEDVGHFAAFFSALLHALYAIEKTGVVTQAQLRLLPEVTAELAFGTMRFTSADLNLLTKTARAALHPCSIRYSQPLTNC